MTASIAYLVPVDDSGEVWAITKPGLSWELVSEALEPEYGNLSLVGFIEYTDAETGQRSDMWILA